MLSVTGKAGETTTITSTSPNKNEVFDTAKVTISDWYDKPIKPLKLITTKMNVVVGNSIKLTAKLSPVPPDNGQITWVSSAPQIATADTKGNIHALTAGSVTVTAKAEANPSIQGSIVFDVRADVKPFIKIDNLAQLINQPIYQRKGLSPLMSCLKASFIHWR